MMPAGMFLKLFESHKFMFFFLIEILMHLINQGYFKVIRFRGKCKQQDCCLVHLREIFGIVDNSEVKTHVFRTSLSRFEYVNDFFGKIDDSEISIVLSF